MNYKQLDIGFNSTPYMLYTRDYSSFETAYIYSFYQHILVFSFYIKWKNIVLKIFINIQYENFIDYILSQHTPFINIQSSDRTWKKNL